MGLPPCPEPWGTSQAKLLLPNKPGRKKRIRSRRRWGLSKPAPHQQLHQQGSPKQDPAARQRQRDGSLGSQGHRHPPQPLLPCLLRSAALGGGTSSSHAGVGTACPAQTCLPSTKEEWPQPPAPTWASTPGPGVNRCPQQELGRGYHHPRAVIFGC